MRSIDSTTAAAIGRGDYIVQWTLLFDIGGTLYGLWGGAGPLTVDGIAYTGAGTLLEFEAADAGLGLSASPITIRLRAQPDSALTPDLLGTIDQYAYKNAPARLSLVYFSRDTGTIVTVLPWWRGYVDVIEHERVAGGDYALVARLEPRSLDHSRTGARMNSDADQRLLDPVDAFFEHAARVPQEKLPYGRASVGAGEGGIDVNARAALAGRIG